MEFIQKTTVPQYKWAGEVKKLYDYTCVYCGKQQTGSLMHAHHVVPKCKNQSLANVLENGVALCHYCHRFGIHSGNGHIKTRGLADRIASVIQEVKECEIILTIPRSRKEAVHAHCEARGESLNSFINRAISEKMARDQEGTE